jgi:hypothetical protein
VTRLSNRRLGPIQRVSQPAIMLLVLAARVSMSKPRSRGGAPIRLHVAADARVYEITSAADWHDLSLCFGDPTTYAAAT